MTCQACKRGFHKHCLRCECCKPTPICRVIENDEPCDKPANVYQMGALGKQVVCPRHRLRFLALLGTLAELERSQGDPE